METFDEANSVNSINLIAKEFKVHKHCYQQFTNGYTQDVRNKEQPSTSNDK